MNHHINAMLAADPMTQAAARLLRAEPFAGPYRKSEIHMASAVLADADRAGTLSRMVIVWGCKRRRGHANRTFDGIAIWRKPLQP